jgi:hypothetical protein
MLPTLIQAAETHGAALMSLVLDIELTTFWQRVMVPHVGELYALLAGTMDSVNRGQGVAANGQCMLVRYDAYALYGGRQDVTQDVAEDRALAIAVSRGGGTIRLEHGELLGSVRPYPTLQDAWAGYTKTLYWAAGRDTTRTLAVALALSMYALLPLWSLLRAATDRRYPNRRSALINAPLQLLPMLALRVRVCRLMGIPASYALAYPLAVVLGNGMLTYSWLRSRSSAGVSWKGRSYKPQPLAGVWQPANRIRK